MQVHTLFGGNWPAPSLPWLIALRTSEFVGIVNATFCSVFLYFGESIG